MNEAKRKKVVYGIFVGAVIFGVVARPWERRQPDSVETAPAPAAAAAVVHTKATVSGNETVGGTQPNFTAEWPKNPFVKSERSEVTPAARKTNPGMQSSSWTLQGVMTVNGQRVCVVNGRTHPTGGMIDGWRIAEIRKEEVLLTRGAEQIRVALR